MKRTIAQAAKKISQSKRNYQITLKSFDELQKERGIFDEAKELVENRGLDQNSKNIIDFLLWMNKNKICSVIQDGRDGTIPHWTDGKKLYNAIELVNKYNKQK